MKYEETEENRIVKKYTAVVKHTQEAEYPENLVISYTELIKQLYNF